MFDETFAVPHYFILRLFVISALISSATSPHAQRVIIRGPVRPNMCNFLVLSSMVKESGKSHIATVHGDARNSVLLNFKS